METIQGMRNKLNIIKKAFFLLHTRNVLALNDSGTCTRHFYTLLVHVIWMKEQHIQFIYILNQQR